MKKTRQPDPTINVSGFIAAASGYDLYFCPHCGFKIANRVSRDDLIRYCWGECLELYREPIPTTFVRGFGPGRPSRETPF